ncbi:D-alanyl-D-alanine carboxypeptidase [Candidatus Giovannonibacteria bacterium]|nr:D-alanyl-D-alanine carboxypeptidase [Candidatus Giovannonibacteria bacterium]
MKTKIIFAAFFLLFLFTFKFSMPTPSAAVPRLEAKEEKKINPNIFAKSAFVFDILENEVIYEKNSLEPHPLASVAKLMTVLLLEESDKIPDYIAISEVAVSQPEGEGLRTGDDIKKDDLERLILAASSNDAAWAAAEFLGKSADDFAFMMNERARLMDLKSLTFFNPNGLDIIDASVREPGAVGNASDIGKLFIYLFKNHPKLLDMTRAYSIDVQEKSGRIIHARNTNEAFGRIPQLIGAKTGFTKVAGGNLVFIFDAGLYHPILVSILGSTEKGRFDDAETIVNAILKYYQEKNSTI